MFDGITVTTIAADAEIFLALLVGGVAIYMAPWFSGQAVKLLKRLIGRT